MTLLRFLATKVQLLAVLLPLLFSTSVIASEWAPKVIPGQVFPEINASDQSGQAWNNSTLSGSKGFLLLFNRSVVW